MKPEWTPRFPLKERRMCWIHEQTGLIEWVYLLQLAGSSDMSPQSLSKSHTQFLLMQIPLAHLNWSSRHTRGGHDCCSSSPSIQFLWLVIIKLVDKDYGNQWLSMIVQKNVLSSLTLFRHRLGSYWYTGIVMHLCWIDKRTYLVDKCVQLQRNVEKVKRSSFVCILFLFIHFTQIVSYPSHIEYPFNTWDIIKQCLPGATHSNGVYQPRHFHLHNRYLHRKPSVHRYSARSHKWTGSRNKFY